MDEMHNQKNDNDEDPSESERESSESDDDDVGPVILRSKDTKVGRWNNHVDEDEEASSSDESLKGNDKKQYL
jgi:hypothetical protein